VTSELVCWGHRDPCDTDPFCDNAGSFTKISVSNFHSCGIRADGTVSCWGHGTNTSSCATYPYHCGQSIPPAGQFVDIAAGNYFFTCGIRADQTLACWGAGSPGSWNWPHYGQSTPPAGTFTSVAAGESHACAIRTDGTVACWGSNNWGEIGAPSGTFEQLAAGASRTCGLRSDDAVVCWGFQDEMMSPPPGFP
jgi:alpha-tubulin suppressor-like RCC1 family protein